jgi:hypothetical protein
MLDASVGTGEQLVLPAQRIIRSIRKPAKICFREGADRPQPLSREAIGGTGPQRIDGRTMRTVVSYLFGKLLRERARSALHHSPLVIPNQPPRRF